VARGVVATDCGFSNESFESGDFSGWTTQDLSIPFLPLTVLGPGFDLGLGFFAGAPTDGDFAVVHGFDGNGALGAVSQIIVAHDIAIPAGETTLQFDYRAGWNFALGAIARLDRSFEVVIRAAGGGEALQTDLILTATAGTTVFDTGDITGFVDISAFAGMTVQLSFEWTIPEDFTGPGMFQLDNIRCGQPLLGSCGGTNQSFETGGFLGWTTRDIDAPLVALTVDTAGVTPGFGFFENAPPDGVFAALHGFDGAGASGSSSQVIVAQDFMVPPEVNRLHFDYRAAWDMLNFAGSTLDRSFEVAIRPAGGGAAFQTELILTAAAGTVNFDTGNLTASVDIGGFSGTTVQLSFEWTIPEDFTGPGFFQLDNIRCGTVLEPGTCGGLNASFETGDFTGWTTEDLAESFFSLAVAGAGVVPGFDSFTSAPTDGDAAVLHGWDGDGGTGPRSRIRVFQDFELPARVSSLEFDYRAGWDLSGIEATLDRHFEVVIRPGGGGAALQTTLMLIASAGEINPDTGDIRARVDVSAFAGTTARVSFEWSVPQDFTGRGFFQLDNIRCGTSVPDFFVRGDGNSDGAVNIADGSYIANAIFLNGAPQPLCLEAADANDDGGINIADPSYVVRAVFVFESPPPPAPFPGCGPDPHPPGFGCDTPLDLSPFGSCP
jgi:hypothetical protein